jgi:hypothetical protein
MEKILILRINDRRQSWKGKMFFNNPTVTVLSIQFRKWIRIEERLRVYWMNFWGGARDARIWRRPGYSRYCSGISPGSKQSLFKEFVHINATTCGTAGDGTADQWDAQDKSDAVVWYFPHRKNSKTNPALGSTGNVQVNHFSAPRSLSVFERNIPDLQVRPVSSPIV